MWLTAAGDYSFPVFEHWPSLPTEEAGNGRQ